MTGFKPATLASVDKDLAESLSRYRAAITRNETDLAALYWEDLTVTLLDRRLELMGAPADGCR